MKEVQLTRYESSDGRLFNNKKDCRLHEEYLEKSSVWVVFNVRYHLRQRPEVFSSRQLAEDSLRNVDEHAREYQYEILELKVDGVLR